MTAFDKLLLPATLFAALGSGLIGGAFFAFSNFVMRALARLPASHGMAAMQSINVTVLNPLFLGVLLGTSAISLFLVIASLLRWEHPAASWLLTGGLLYFLGNFVVTMVFNVPRNEALARLDATSPEAVAVWLDYVKTWTRWNHVRTVTALAAAAAFTMALCQLKAAAE